ncbi:VOC family protein [Kitasatospora sp. NPDC048540]|uniref:VOC family protein n=1 Tax=Kitasatospora sp. NPDC048540 TaxID=3155634 RepID=UPI0033E31557
MHLASIRVITEDVARLVEFYERVTRTAAVWSNEDFAEITAGSDGSAGAGTLAIGSTRTVPLFAPGSAEAGANRSAIVEFLVDDVDALHTALAGHGTEFVNEPTTMPWGNRSLLLRDPDGNLVNLFTPVTPAAKAKFGR